jgi:hypothetical protein
MGEIAEDTLILARNGQVGEMEAVSLVDTIGKYGELIATSATTLGVEDDIMIRADPDCARHICESLLRTAVEHGGGYCSGRPGGRTDDLF